MLSLYGIKEPGPFWAASTTTTTPSEISMNAQPASSVFLNPTSSGKSNQAASTVPYNTAPEPAIVETTTENSSKPTTADSSAARSCFPLGTLRPITPRPYTSPVAVAHQ